MRTRRFIFSRQDGERGVALITTMLIMMLMSALMIGLTTVVTSDQKYRYIDRDRAKAFYGAHSGLEKLTAELADLFFVNVAPSASQIAALANETPTIPDVTFVTSGTGQYGVVATSTQPAPGQISTGPYQGLYALKRTYELNSSVHTTDGGEAHLKRYIETVAIPVFQFGMFSDVDLSFHAGPNFNFGGRIHTNGNLFIAEGNGATLTLEEKVTAVKDVIRNVLVNGVAVATSAHEGTVKMATAPGAYRNLALNEGSLINGPGTAVNDSWSTLSLSTYNGYIRSGKTGAKQLNLPLLTSGGANTDLVRRPVINENITNDVLFNERYFTKVSLRILLSDLAADITNLPTVTPLAPVSLDGDWTQTPPNNGTAYVVAAATPPIARTPVPIANTFKLTNAGVGTGAAQNLPTATAIPNFWKIPAVLSTVDSVGTPVTFSCTGRTAPPTTVNSTFTGCTTISPFPATAHQINAGAVITGQVPTVNVSPVIGANVTVTTTVSTLLNWNAGATVAINVASNAQFAPQTLWVENTNGTNVLVNCLGYDTTPRFTNCNVTTALQANAVITNASLAPQGTGTIGGFIKIERQNTNGGWTDVTMEILNYGISGVNIQGRPCGDPSPNAIVRIQRLKDNADPVVGTPCVYAGSMKAEDQLPNVLFDTREGLQRDVNPGTDVACAASPTTCPTLRLGGVIHYITLDVANLSKWFAGTAPFNAGSGPNSLSTNGYSVYFSDRRHNRTTGNVETGEYGFEDIVNPADAAGAANAVLDIGEDVNANNAVDTYGQFPSYNGISGAVPPGASAPLDAAARPWTDVRAPRAMTNRALLFRHALKLINGTLGSIVAPGLTISSENPVYIQGDWNASAAAGFANPHVATSVVADSVTLLSNAWNDWRSLTSPYTPGNRARSADSYYRVAIIGGKNAPFPYPGTPPTDFGTDGGAHNFLRMLEAGGGTVHYRGSIATFFYSRQAVGVYKGGTTVYGAPTRDFRFDTDFLDPALLPPLTPVFRDLNSLGFTQEIRPGK